jgi:hypothetical protein
VKKVPKTYAKKNTKKPMLTVDILNFIFPFTVCTTVKKESKMTKSAMELGAKQNVKINKLKSK